MTQLNPTKLKQLKQFNLEHLNYVPFATQQAVHDSDAQIVVVSGGEGGGKSKVTAAEVALRNGSWNKVLFVCYKSKSARNESDYLYDLLSQFGVVASYHAPRDGEIEIKTKDGSLVHSVSTYAEGSRAVSGTGQSYDIICMLEAGKQRYEVFLACLLRRTRTKGLLILSGTIEKSEPWFADILRSLEKPDNELGAKVYYLPTWGNTVDYPLGENEPALKVLKGKLGEDLYLERCAGRPAPLHSLVFKEFSFLTHVFDWVRYDDQSPIELWIDPGYSGSHYSVIFVQFHPRSYTRQFRPELPEASLMDVYVIGDLYLDHAIHEEVIKTIQEVAPYSEWYNHITGAVGDIAMTTHPLAGQSPDEVWKEKTHNRFAIRGRYLLIQDGIDRHHTFLKDPQTDAPRLFFNESCKGLAEYGKWQRKEIGENLYGEPEKGNCDFLKAIDYGLVDNFGLVEHVARPHPVAFGERPLFKDIETQLPNVRQIPGMLKPLSQKPSIVAQHPQYISVPRQTKKIG